MTSTPDEWDIPTGAEGTVATPGPTTAVGPSGRYRLGALLGRGGMADVYQARDRTLGRDVAVKLLRDRTPDPTDRARFVAEAQTLARLNHPNLVTILDAGISDEHPYLVLELVVGSSLSVTLAQADQGLPPERVAHLGAQIAAALAHCHASGIVHRDVKPGNILLGAGDRALLTDFGISRLLDGSTHHTQTGTTIGTASYLAPEQVHGDEVTPAADLYALGLVMLEACTGRREYPGTPVEAAVARLHRSPRVPPGLPAVLSGALTSLTQTDPTMRPAAAETAQLLTAGLSGAQTETTVTVSADRRRRPPLLALAGWVAAAAAALALAVTVRGMAPDGPTPSTSTTTPPPASASASPAADVAPAADTSPTVATPASSTQQGGTRKPARGKAAAKAQPTPQKATKKAAQKPAKKAAAKPAKKKAKKAAAKPKKSSKKG